MWQKVIENDIKDGKLIMKWLDKWFYNRWVEAKHEYEEYPSKTSEPNYAIKIGSGSNVRGSHDLRSQGMNFVIYPATGGHIVEYQSYDQKTDHHIGKLHIITSEDDIGTSLGHIVTLEYLSK